MHKYISFQIYIFTSTKFNQCLTCPVHQVSMVITANSELPRSSRAWHIDATAFVYMASWLGY